VDYLPTPSNPKDLPSYRFSALTRIQEGDGAGTSSTFKSEWIRDQQAEHAWQEDGAGKVTELYIIIGSEQWSYAGGQWVKQAPAASVMPVDIAAQIREVLKNPSAAKARIVKKSTNDVMNNIICDRYEVEYTLGGAHTVGELYIGAGLGAQPAIMQCKLTTDTTVGGKKTVVYVEQNVYDVDRVNKTISPP